MEVLYSGVILGCTSLGEELHSVRNGKENAT